MAERSMNKRPPRSHTPKPPEASQAASSAKQRQRRSSQPVDTAIARLDAAAIELKRDRETLTAELQATRALLAAANAEIAALDAARRATIDRIDWVIDSLQTILQEKP